MRTNRCAGTPPSVKRPGLARVPRRAVRLKLAAACRTADTLAETLPLCSSPRHPPINTISAARSAGSARKSTSVNPRFAVFRQPSDRPSRRLSRPVVRALFRAPVLPQRSDFPACQPDFRRRHNKTRPGHPSRLASHPYRQGNPSASIQTEEQQSRPCPSRTPMSLLLRYIRQSQHRCQ